MEDNNQRHSSKLAGVHTPPNLQLLLAATEADIAALYTCDEPGANLLLTAVLGEGSALPVQLSLAQGLSAPPGLPMALLLPVESEGVLLGALLLARTRPAPFDARAKAAAELAAEREAAVLVAARLAAADAARERLVGQIIERIPSSLVVVDRALRVTLANRNFLLKAGRQQRGTLGRPLAELFPAALLRYTRLEHKVRDVFRSGRPSEGERLTYSAPGLPSRTYYYQLMPLGSAPVEQVLLLLEDITERERLGEEVRRAERHLAGVVACASDLVVSLDREGHVLTWNPAAECVSGLSAEAVVGRSLAGLCVPEQREVIRELIERLRTGENRPPTEAELAPVGREPVPIAWAGAAMRDNADAVVGFVLVGRDLTERRRLELQLVQHAKSVSLGVMAAGIAHEIRNPLGIIAAAAQLMADHSCDEPMHVQAAQRATRAAQRAGTIIEDLLTFARPERDRPGQVKLNELVEDTLALLAPQPSLALISMTLNLAPSLPPILGSPGLLQQVLTNLILNACAAMPIGGKLTISTSRDDAWLVLEVTDTGHGIPAQLLPRIFDPFFTTAPVGRGTGLGLAISHSIVRQHGGRIEVSSQVGIGSTFRVWLPTT